MVDALPKSEPSHLTPQPFLICTDHATVAKPLLKELCKDLQDQGISEALSPEEAEMHYVRFCTDEEYIYNLIASQEKVVSRYLGMLRVAHKDFLAKAMQAAEHLQPGSTDFVPASFVLPRDMDKLQDYERDHGGCTYVAKPRDGL